MHLRGNMYTHLHVVNPHTFAICEINTCPCAATACAAALLRIAGAAAQAEHDMLFLPLLFPLTVAATFGDPVVLH